MNATKLERREAGRENKAALSERNNSLQKSSSTRSRRQTMKCCQNYIDQRVKCHFAPPLQVTPSERELDSQRHLAPAGWQSSWIYRRIVWLHLLYKLILQQLISNLTFMLRTCVALLDPTLCHLTSPDMCYVMMFPRITPVHIILKRIFLSFRRQTCPLTSKLPTKSRCWWLWSMRHSGVATSCNTRSSTLWQSPIHSLLSFTDKFIYRCLLHVYSMSVTESFGFNTLSDPATTQGDELWHPVGCSIGRNSTEDRFVMVDTTNWSWSLSRDSIHLTRWTRVK